MSIGNLTMTDLFSGAGGLSEGLSEAGFHSLFASEIDWWGFGATLVVGVLTAIATMAAVIYANSRTKAIRRAGNKI